MWPEPTHAPRDSEAVKSGRLKPWRSAAEIIDWSLPCPSIFDTKEEIKERYNLKAVRPLADNTMRRIIRGVDKFTIKSGQPYIVPTGYGERKGQAPRVHDIEEPLPTVVGSGKHNLCKPVLAPFTATNTSNSVGAPAGDPVHTVTTAGNQMLVTPYLAECNHAGGGHVADVRGPYKTITAKHTGGIVAPSLIQYHTEQTENVRASGLGAPIPTVDASNRYGLTCANLVKYYSGVVGEKMEEPLPTVTAIDHNAVCAAHVVKFKGDNLGSSPAEPMQTVTAGAGQKKACGGGTFALCDTLLCKAGPDENLYRWPLIRELLNRYCGYIPVLPLSTVCCSHDCAHRLIVCATERASFHFIHGLFSSLSQFPRQSPRVTFIHSALADRLLRCVGLNKRASVSESRPAFARRLSKDGKLQLHFGISAPSTIVSPIQYLTRYSLLLPSFFCFTGWTEYPFRNRIEATVTRSASLPILR